MSKRISRSGFICFFIIHTEYLCGPYPSSERKNVMYNARTRKPIDFWTEIDPARLGDFKEYLNHIDKKQFRTPFVSRCRPASRTLSSIFWAAAPAADRLHYLVMG